MARHDLIADKIEEVIGEMFSDFPESVSRPTEYSIVFNPQKHNTWFILIFFKDKADLKKAIEIGKCYTLYKYLITKFERLEGIKAIEKVILFEPGNRPLNQGEFERLFDKLTQKLQNLRNSTGDVEQALCAECGHDFNSHQLMTFLKDEDETANEGWIMCPEENCICFNTWSANYNGVPSAK